MNRIPVIDVAATGLIITRLRVNAGLTVKDLQDVSASTPRRPSTSGSAVLRYHPAYGRQSCGSRSSFWRRPDDILIFQSVTHCK